MPGTWNSGMARRHEFGGQKLAGKSRFYTMGFYGLRMGNYGIFTGFFTGSQKAGFSLKYGNLWEEYGFFMGRIWDFPLFVIPPPKYSNETEENPEKHHKKGKVALRIQILPNIRNSYSNTYCIKHRKVHFECFVYFPCGLPLPSSR